MKYNLMSRAKKRAAGDEIGLLSPIFEEEIEAPTLPAAEAKADEERAKHPHLHYWLERGES